MHLTMLDYEVQVLKTLKTKKTLFALAKVQIICAAEDSSFLQVLYGCPIYAVQLSLMKKFFEVGNDSDGYVMTNNLRSRLTLCFAHPIYLYLVVGASSNFQTLTINHFCDCGNSSFISQNKKIILMDLSLETIRGKGFCYVLHISFISTQ